MQTTLLGLAIAIILALLAALVGPLLIDWGGHRSLFEAEASRLIGVDVRVTGAIDARLLPSPQLMLHEIEVGSGSDKIRATSLGIEFALGSLMRGDWRASEMHLVGPRVTLGLDTAGRVQAPNIAVAFDPDGLTIDRLSIENGQVTLTDAASGVSVTLERLWFNGEARSLIGPFKGEGAVTIGGELYPYRIAAGRYGDDGTLKLRVNVDPVNHPLSIEADGTLALAGGTPKFEGSLSLARPVGIASRRAAQVTQTVSQPWRVSGKLKASAQSALIEQAEFQYGSEEQGLKLNGVADFKFGKNPRFDGVLSGRQIDLDRALASGTGSRLLPAAAIRELAELGGGAFRPAIPIQIGVGIDQITLGGNSVQNLRGDLSADAQGWNLDRFEFRAPGFTQVRLSGHLAVGVTGAAFTGPAEIEAVDPKALAAWLEGRGETVQGELRPLSLRGEVTLASEKVAVERLKAEFDRKPIAGRLVYVFAAANKSAKLDAELNAPELDIDAALGFGNALLAGSAIERPHDMTIAVDIGRATVAGFVARNASVRLKVDGDGLQIDRLAVADLGGAAFSASGRIVTAAPSPQGSMRLDLDAPDMKPVMAVLARFAPEIAQALARGAPMMAPAKLHARLTIDGAVSATRVKLGIDGNLGKVRLALNGQADADPIAFSVGDLRLDAKFEADEGKALVAMLGLDRLVVANAGPGALTVNASGPARGDLRVESWLTAGGLEANVSGAARLLAGAPSAALRATIVKADMAPLRGPSGGHAALPVALTTRVTLAGNDVSLADINATIAGSVVRGKLEIGLARPYRLRGEIEAGQVDGASLVGASIGMPAPSGNNSNASFIWSSEPFADGAFGDFTGQIALKARRFDLLPQVTAREFRASLRFAKDEFTFDDITGDVAGGRLTGRASFRTVNNGLQARAKVSVSGADAASLLSAGARPPVTGALGFAAEIAGAGLSPVALIGSLQGAGNISLTDAQFAGLDPRAFDAVTRAVDQGLPVDAGRISNVVSKALDSGQLSIKRVEGTIAISAGRMQLNNVTADAKDAVLSLYGNLDLTDGSLDAHLVLSGLSQAAGARPDIFMALKGPVAKPSRSIDIAALSGWLTLRAIENQAKRLREIERAPQQPESQPPPPKSEQAPALPAPVDIRPAPAPRRERQPAASVGPQN
ncbi:MAG: AsmA family protein [Rhizobiales bacterium]|nr:AsmA family protein [Hyphomicrobiales bacterium]